MDFESASFIFLDPARIEQYDDREDYGEDRWITIGRVEFGVLVVVYTVRDANGEIRLISARKANAKEERVYRHLRT